MTDEDSKKPRRRFLTPQVIEANRKNALKSTGPKTTQGKDAVKYNAVKHGILSDAVHLIRDRKEETAYQEVLESLVVALEPEGPLENMLVEKLAITHWRYSRLVRYEVTRSKMNMLRQQFASSGDSTMAHVGERYERLWDDLKYDASGSIPKGDDMDRILKYQGSLERSFYRALDSLERLQRMRKGQHIDEPKIVHVDGDKE
jgi:hypothetical protein